MTNHILRSRRITPYLLIVVICISTACSGPGSPSPVDEAPSGVGVVPDEGLPETLGIVLDPMGTPVPFAIVGDSELTSQEGVFSGMLDVYPSGWTTVKAMGYATAFTRPFGEYRGVDLYETRLTPIQVIEPLVDGELTLLVVEGESGLTLALEIDAGTMPDSLTFVGLTNLGLLDVGPVHESLPSATDLKPVFAFSVAMLDDVLEEIALPEGTTYSLNFNDAGQLSESATLAAFAPESGDWVETPDSCSRETQTSLHCTLHQASPLMAWFDVDDSTAAQRMEEFAITPHSLMAMGPKYLDYAVNPLVRVAQDEEDLDDDFKVAYKVFTKWVKEQERKNGGVNSDDPTGKKLLEDLFKAARDFANRHRDEVGKFHLLLAGQSAMILGFEGGEALVQEATEISNELGRKALNESDCGQFKKLFLAAQQIQLLGGDQNLSDQLNNKARELAKDCDVWVGWIEVILPAESSHPMGLPMHTYGGWWREHHTVMMATNVETYVMHGTDKVQLSFPEVEYMKEDKCKMTITMFGQPAGSTQMINITGMYDGSFQIQEYVPDTEGIGIAQTWDFEGKVDGVCQIVYEYEIATQNFVSIVVHGFSFDNPTITLQHMLDEGSKGTNLDLQPIVGSEDIVNPAVDLAIYPVIRGSVVWKFMHTQNKIPLSQ